MTHTTMFTQIQKNTPSRSLHAIAGETVPMLPNQLFGGGHMKLSPLSANEVLDGLVGWWRWMEMRLIFNGVHRCS